MAVLQHPDALWARVIGSIHKNSSVGITRVYSLGGLSPWQNMLKEFAVLRDKGLDLEMMCKKKVGNGMRTRFWTEDWTGMGLFKDQFPRVFAYDPCPEATVYDRNYVEKLTAAVSRQPRRGVLLAQWEELCAVLAAHVFVEVPDAYVWDLTANGEFLVFSTRTYLDSVRLGCAAKPTRWNPLVPIKVNILSWRIERDRVPSCINLRERCIDLPSVVCPLCEVVGESVEHLFAACILIFPIWKKIAQWWNVEELQGISVQELFQWEHKVSSSAIICQRLEE